MELIDKPTSEFIREHRNDDVRKLAFTANKYPSVDFPLALDQIQGWQTARKKLPSWAAVDGIVYPPHINMEQCSSEFTAKYKASLFDGVGQKAETGSTLIDLTGGFGVDFSFLSPNFDRAVYVERNSKLCTIAKHNFALLGLRNIEVVNSDSVDFLAQGVSNLTDEHSITIFLDPARRDSYGRKMASISDCEPDVISLLPELAKIADRLFLKLSPMLDWHEAVREINGDYFTVTSVHIVSVRNECKELLITASRSSIQQPSAPLLHCINDGQAFVCPVVSPSASPSVLPSVAFDVAMRRPTQRGNEGEQDKAAFLYVPNSSIMKAGCFSAVASQFALQPVGMNSHLFVSARSISDFPGKRFQIIAVSSMNKHELRANMAGIKKANISVRNFPMSVDALRKRLKVEDGGDVYIFATTVAERSHVLIITKKAE